MQSLARVTNNISEWSGKLLILVPWAITAVIVLEITLRSILGKPTIWAHETSVMIFGAYSILVGAYALRYRAHVNMDLFYSRLSPRGKAILDVATFPLFLVFCGILLWQGGEFAWRSIELQEISVSFWGPPIWPVKCTIVIGVFLILLQGIGKFVSDFLTTIRKK